MVWFCVGFIKKNLPANQLGVSQIRKQINFDIFYFYFQLTYLVTDWSKKGLTTGW